MRTVTLFVISTTSDFAAEHAILQEKVAPRLANACQRNGWGLRIVNLDPHADVPEGDYSALRERLESFEKPLHPLFLYLAGDKLGWCPLPAILPAELADVLIEKATVGERMSIKEAYAHDKNDATSSEGDLHLIQPNHPKVADALRSVASRVDLTKEQAITLGASATQRELLAVWELEGLANELVCAVRTLQNVTLLQERTYYDLLPNGKRDPQAQESVEAFNAWLGGVTDDAVRYTIDLAQSEDERRRRLEQVSNDLSARLELRLLDLVEKVGSEDEEERHLHEKWSKSLHDRFVVREEEAAAGLEFIIKAQEDAEQAAGGGTPKPAPFVIVGERGCGKTYLMAELAARVDELSAIPSIVRFVGLTETSLNVSQLLRSIRTQDDGAPLFVDGIERVDDPAALVRGIVEMGRPAPVVLSVSEDGLSQIEGLLPPETEEATLTAIQLTQAASMLDSQIEYRGRTMTKMQRKVAVDVLRLRTDGRLVDKLTDILLRLTSLDDTDALEALLGSGRIEVDDVLLPIYRDELGNEVSAGQVPPEPAAVEPAAAQQPVSEPSKVEPQNEPPAEVPAQEKPTQEQPEATSPQEEPSDEQKEPVAPSATTSIDNPAEPFEAIASIAKAHSEAHPGEPLPAAALNECFRYAHDLGKLDENSTQGAVNALRFMETYAFLERCGAITKESIEDSSVPAIAPSLFLRGRELALAAQPEPLRQLIDQRDPDPEFFVSHLNDAYQAMFPNVDLEHAEESAREANPFDPAMAPGQDVERETPEERMAYRADLAASAVAFAMTSAYSVFDRLDEVGGDGVQITKRSLARLIMDQLSESREQLKDQITFYESSARGRVYLTKLSRIGK